MVHACVLPVDPTVCSLSQVFLSTTGIFNVFSTFSFFFVITPYLRLYGPKCNPFLYFYGVRYNPWPSIARLWRCNSSSWRRVALLSLTAFATPAALPINDSSAPNIDKISNISPRFTVRSTRFFIVFFRLHFRLHTHADPRFNFHCRTNGCCSSSLFESRISRDNTLLRFLSEYFVTHVSFREIVAMRIGYVVLATRCVQWVNASLLTNRFFKCVPGSQNWYPEICNSKGSGYIAQFNKPQLIAADIRRNSLSMVPNRQNAFDDT